MVLVASALSLSGDCTVPHMRPCPMRTSCTPLLTPLLPGHTDRWTAPTASSAACHRAVRCVQAVLQCDARAVLRSSSSPVVAISLTSNGLPCLTLANAHAYAYHTQLGEWMRVADWGFPASAHHSVMAGGSAGEISSLLAAAEAQRPRAAIFDAMQVVCACPPPSFHLSTTDAPAAAHRCCVVALCGADLK